MTLVTDTAGLLRRHAPALALALVLHLAAGAAILAGVQNAKPPHREAARKVVAELITLPRRMETPLAAPALSKQSAPAVPKRQAPSVPKETRMASQPASPASPAHGPAEAPAPAAGQPAAAAPVVPAAPAAAPVTAPRFDAAYLNNPRPAYPLAARKLGEEGTVMLNVRVSTDGSPAKIEVRTSSGSERLDEAARNAVAQWRFVPAKQGEEPVAAWVVVPLVFKMNG